MMYVLIALAIAFTLYVQLGPKLTNMKEGMWSITVETKMPGEETSFPSTHRQLLTKAKPVPEISIPGYTCRLFRRRHPMHIVGNTVWWKVYCEGDGPDISGAACIKFKGDTFAGSIQMHTLEEDQKRFKTTLSGYHSVDSE